MAITYQKIVRNAVNQICVLIDNNGKTVMIEAENLKASITRPGVDEDFAAAAQEGLRAVNAFRDQCKMNFSSLSQIPYHFTPRVR